MTICSRDLPLPEIQPTSGPSTHRAVASSAGTTRDVLARVYTDAHLGLVGIHPYADGNGRMARLLANIPLLRAGWPPLLVSAGQRRDYMVLLGDYSLRRGQPRPGEPLVLPGLERDALETLFATQWKATRELVDEYHSRQVARTPEVRPGP